MGGGRFVSGVSEREICEWGGGGGGGQNLCKSKNTEKGQRTHKHQMRHLHKFRHGNILAWSRGWK